MDTDQAISLVERAEALRPNLMGLDGRTTVAQLEALYPDLGRALDHLVAEGRADGALRLATALAPFWSATRRLTDAAARFDAVLATPGGDGAVRGRACFEAGLLAFWQGDDERSRRLHDEALKIGRSLDDADLTALALSGHARIELRSGTDEARRLCREALAVCEGRVARRGRGSALHVLGVAAQMAGALEEARGLMSERLDMARSDGNFAGVSSEAGNLSLVELQLGDLERAAALALEGLAIDVARGDEWAFPYKLNALAAIAVRRGELERAATLLGAAEAMLEAQGAQWPPDEREHFEHTSAALADAGSEGVDDARAAGRRMAPDEAVGFAGA